jgi:hypothetical protein
MAQFEIHLLRGTLTAFISYAQIAARERLHMRHVVGHHKAAWHAYEESMGRALRDPDYRRNLAGLRDHNELEIESNEEREVTPQ